MSPLDALAVINELNGVAAGRSPLVAAENKGALSSFHVDLIKEKELADSGVSLIDRVFAGG